MKFSVAFANGSIRVYKGEYSIDAGVLRIQAEGKPMEVYSPAGWLTIEHKD